MIKKILPLILFTITCISSYSQDTTSVDIDALLNDNTEEIVYAKNAFKSTRVINSQSIEMLGKGVLDTRILHRFGNIGDGIGQLFGLDQASMRMGFDYGVSKNFSIGIGRSTYKKELDGFVKYRILHQHSGKKNMPISLIYVGGTTINTLANLGVVGTQKFDYRLGYFHQLLIGRKFNSNFSMQLSPTFVHQNLVATAADFNDKIAIGIGARYKITNRTAILIDANPIVYGATKNVNTMPLSIGFDIETGGHVFQLHFSNSFGMNERAFIGETTQGWDKGAIKFGFNLSRVFTVVQNKSESW